MQLHSGDEEENNMKLNIEEYKKKRDFYCETGATSEQIENAETELGLRFAEEYKEYLQQFGAVSCGGHELTGFSADENLDVVHVTVNNLKRNPNISKPFYVIEETHIDGIVIWQTETGEIYKTEYKGSPQKIFESLAEYITTFEELPDLDA